MQNDRSSPGPEPWRIAAGTAVSNLVRRARSRRAGTVAGAAVLACAMYAAGAHRTGHPPTQRPTPDLVTVRTCVPNGWAAAAVPEKVRRLNRSLAALGNDGVFYYPGYSTYAIDTSSGKLIWRHGYGGQAAVGNGGPAYCAGGHLQNTVKALERQAGRVLWSRNTADDTGFIAASPSGHMLYVHEWEGALSAIDADGKLRWRVSNRRGWPEVGMDGTVYMRGSRPDTGETIIAAMDGETGRDRWQFRSGSTFFLGEPRLALDGTVTFIGRDNNRNPTIDSVDARTGRLLRRIPAPLAAVGHDVGSDGTIYCEVGGGGKQRAIHALDGRTGRVKWVFVPPFGNARRTASGLPGWIYVDAYDMREAGALFALDAASGRVKWEFQGPGGLPSDPLVGPDGTVYIGFRLNPSVFRVFALDGRTGKVRWKYPESESGETFPLIAQADNRVGNS